MKRICITATALLCALLLVFTGCTANSQQETLVSINGREIGKPEFMLYLFEATKDFKYIGGTDIWETDFDGQTAQEILMERTLNTLQTVILSCQRAERYGVKLTADDVALAAENGSAEWEGMTEAERTAVGISKEEMITVMEDTLLYSKVYNAVTKDFKPSSADFQAYLDQHREGYEDQYTKFTISSIMINDEETAKLVSKKAKAGEDFSALFQQYDADKSETANANGVMETFKGKLDTAFGVDFQYAQGEISQPLKTADGYFIIRVDSIVLPTEEELLNIANTDYTALRKRQIFDAELAQWLADAKIDKNDEALSAIEMIQ